MIYLLATFQSHTPRTWKEHLSLSQPGWGKGSSGAQWGGGKDAMKCATKHRTGPTAKTYWTQDQYCCCGNTCYRWKKSDPELIIIETQCVHFHALTLTVYVLEFCTIKGLQPRLVYCSGTNQRVTCSIPSQGTCLGCKPGPQQGAHERQPHIDVFPSLFPSLPLSKK